MPGRPPFAGVLKILQFNWPWYLGALMALAAGELLRRSGFLPAGPRPWIAGAMALGAFWMLASLLASHWVYDRSGLADGGWLKGIHADRVRRIAVFHAGQDEASEILTLRLPSASRAAYDFYDTRKESTDSLRRARASAESVSTSVDAGRLPLEDASLDLVCLIFAGHEIRQDGDRVIFFKELRRVLDAGGGLIVVEHLRDGWNALAYGPNAFHFLSRATWETTFAASGFQVLEDSPCTPFVRIFRLEPRP